MGRILGIDYGDRRVGLALSDPSGTLACALDVVEQSPRLWEVLRDVLAREEVERIVLGLPRNMDGTLGPKARQVLAFKEKLEKECGAPVETWDERLTTAEAHEVLTIQGVSRSHRARVVDKVAAQILLQSYLDCRKLA